MKEISLPFNFEPKLEGNFSNAQHHFPQNNCKNHLPFLSTEPTSVLHNINSPSPPTSVTTLSSSSGTASASAVSGHHHSLLPQPPEIDSGGNNWETLLPNSCLEAQVQSESMILKWITRDIQDSFLDIPGSGPAQHESIAGFHCVNVNQATEFDPIALFAHGNGNCISTAYPNAVQIQDLRPQIDNLNQFHSPQAQIPGLFFPIGSTPEAEEEQLMPPQPKRQNYRGDYEPVPRFFDSSQQLEVLQPHNLLEVFFKVGESIQTWNLVQAQQILARLNQQLSAPIGKPLLRAAFYFKEALQLLLYNNSNSINDTMTSPFALVFKIAAYKYFSEISPLVQFANFTCNQAILEATQGYNHIHIIDFNIGFGFGDQWGSLMQELALRDVGPTSLKITTITSDLMIDQMELKFACQNLYQLASEIGIQFKFEIIGIDVVLANSSSPLFLRNSDAVVVNLPPSSYFALPSILRFIKLVSPKIVLSLDLCSDRADLCFPNHVTLALQSHANLLESLEAANMDEDILQKVEQFVIQPLIEKIVIGRSRSLDKTQHWRTAFLSAGLSPLIFSSFNESQAECLVKRTHVHGFHIEKQLGSLVLCWQRKDLVSVSAWRW